MTPREIYDKLYCRRLVAIKKITLVALILLPSQAGSFTIQDFISRLFGRDETTRTERLTELMKKVNLKLLVREKPPLPGASFLLPCPCPCPPGRPPRRVIARRLGEGEQNMYSPCDRRSRAYLSGPRPPADPSPPHRPPGPSACMPSPEREAKKGYYFQELGKNKL